MNIWFPGSATLARRVQRGSGSSTTLTASIVASANPTPAEANFTYTVQVDNTGSLTATSITATVTLDSSLTYVSASGTGWGFSQTGQTVTCTLASLAGSTNANAITITVTAGDAADASVTSGVSAAGSNTNTATGSSMIAVVQPTDTVTIVDNLRVAGATLAAGPNFNYTVQYTNLGTGTVYGISVATTLDASLTYVSSSGTGWTIGRVGQVVTATLTSLATGAANPITITVTPGAAGALSTGVSATASNAATATATATGTSYACTKDATSGKFWPSSATEWANALTVAGIASGGAPRSIWNCQDSSGGLADANGNNAMTATGSPSYQQAVSGWTRKGVSLGADGNSNKFSNASWPTTASNSFLMLAMISVTTPAAVRLMFGATSLTNDITNGGKMRVFDNANTTDGAGTIGGAGVLLLAYRYKIGTTGQGTGFTLTEKLNPTASSVTATAISIGSGTSPALTCLGAAGFSGANAEITDADLKILEQTFGWSPSWT